MLEFGWPLGFDREFEECGNTKITKNHSGARDFAKDIDKYIKKEVGYGAVLGPFASNPFNDHLVMSPLNSVPKANSEERRVIMDLSFPKDVSVELKHDLLWWSEFLEIYNLQEWTEPDEYMASDACLVGCGGVSNGQFFHCAFPDFIVQQNLHINALELLSIIVCLKLCGQKGRNICIQCDNMVSIQVINQGKSRSRFLQACLREICFICAIKECELRAIHIDGIDNRLPDMLSRWRLSDIYPIQFYSSIEDRNVQHINVDSNFFQILLQLVNLVYLLFKKGLKRCNPHSVRAALPIAPSILLKIREESDFDDVNSYTYWCIFLFAFYLICRKSNLVGTVDDSSKCLHREDISVFKDYLLVEFHWSKTIQFGERVLEIPIIKNLSSPLCAFITFKAMCIKFPVAASSPAVLVLPSREIKPVSYNMLQTF
ncbi:unnamed protein product [Mytilus coruscus]|uniref:Uncharacterized protein n=1 Tax=Mytilus coruscus TaxID=42192 RepID=A0A6J8BSH9_MYTCO|nr:unnamed protein product [Mytilus coruscus]